MNLEGRLLGLKNWCAVLSLFLVIGCATSLPKPESSPEISTQTNEPSTSTVESRSRKTSEKHAATVKSPFTLVLIDHGGYQEFYDAKLRSARYVKYIGLAENMRGTRAKRKDKFIADPMLIEKGLPYVSPKEYIHSGYDKGHLAPAGDFAYSDEASNSTFVMSNMSPQKPKLNQYAWRLLEAQVRKWICGEERVLVITGPIFSEDPETLKSGLPIPMQYFKIVRDETPPKKTLAFIYNQTDTKDVMIERIVAISEIEKKTKIDFSAELLGETRPNLRRPSSIEGWKEDDCK